MWRRYIFFAENLWVDIKAEMKCIVFNIVIFSALPTVTIPAAGRSRWRTPSGMRAWSSRTSSRSRRRSHSWRSRPPSERRTHRRLSYLRNAHIVITAEEGRFTVQSSPAASIPPFFIGTPLTVSHKRMGKMTLKKWRSKSLWAKSFSILQEWEMALKRKLSDCVSPLHLDDQVECLHEPLKRLELNELEVYLQESSHRCFTPWQGCSSWVPSSRWAWPSYGTSTSSLTWPLLSKSSLSRRAPIYKAAWP